MRGNEQAACARARRRSRGRALALRVRVRRAVATGGLRQAVTAPSPWSDRIPLPTDACARRLQTLRGLSLSRSTGQGRRICPVVRADGGGHVDAVRQPKASWIGRISSRRSDMQQRAQEAHPAARRKTASRRLAGNVETRNLQRGGALLLATRAPTRRALVRCRACRSSRPRPPDTRRIAERHAGGSKSRSQRSTLKPGMPIRASDCRTKAGTVPRSSAITRDAPGCRTSASAAHPARSARALLRRMEVRRLRRAESRTCGRSRPGDRRDSRRTEPRSGAHVRAASRSRPHARPSDRPAAPNADRFSLNASGGTPTDASRSNWFCRTQTSALSRDTMNGRSPKRLIPVRSRRASCHCSHAIHWRYSKKSMRTGGRSGRAVSAAGSDGAARGPVGPGAGVEAIVERPEQRVVGPPPCLFAPEGLEPPGAGVPGPTRRRGNAGGGLERLALDTPDVIVLDRLAFCASADDRGCGLRDARARRVRGTPARGARKCRLDRGRARSTRNTASSDRSPSR